MPDQVGSIKKAQLTTTRVPGDAFAVSETSRNRRFLNIGIVKTKQKGEGSDSCQDFSGGFDIV